MAHGKSQAACMIQITISNGISNALVQIRNLIFRELNKPIYLNSICVYSFEIIQVDLSGKS